MISPPVVIHNSKDVFLQKLDIYSSGFNSISFRPKYSDQIGESKNFSKQKEKVAIVIQGPIIEEDKFTFETVKLYQKNYSDHILIVSTWSDISSQLIEDFRSLNIELVLNEKPSCSGSLNVNFQITSTLNGLRKAKELGCEFAYKTRSDQRFYEKNVTQFLISCITKNPLNEHIEYLKHKLISCSMTTLKYRPYGIGDMFMFGYIDDILLYWDSKLDSRNLSKDSIPLLSVYETAKLKLAETYFCTNFLDKINYRYDFTLLDSRKVYAKFFFIVDYDQINLFWFKYDWRNETRFKYWRDHSYELYNSKDNIVTDFSKWEEKLDVVKIKEGEYL